MSSVNHIVALFEQQVASHGRATAVKHDEIELTYNELNERANRVARIILDAAGNHRRTSGQSVALLFGHTPDMIIGILGILKSGNCYVPLDPTYPEERLIAILADSKVNVLLSNYEQESLAQKLLQRLHELGLQMQIVNLDRIDSGASGKNLNTPISPQQHAYVTYTSGSTGKPKGVIQTHENAVHFIRHYSDMLKVGSSDRISLLTSYSHTVSVIDIFSALFNGAAICLYDVKAEANPANLTEWLKQEQITIYHSVPTLFRLCMESLGDDERLLLVRLVILGGEMVYKNDVDSYKKHFAENCVFVNLFGSSELIIATSYMIDMNTELARNIVPIGYPVEGVAILLLDEKQTEVNVFAVGELAYKSAYLSPEYINSSEPSGQYFLHGSTENHRQLYRSGDLGRLLPDGSIEHIGRKDFQVKIRGQRVELGEIEAVLDGVADIKKSVVKLGAPINGEDNLIAYYTTGSEAELNSDELRKALLKKLPVFMVPRFFVFMKNLPLTPNGKIDRQALPAQSDLELGPREYVAPQNEIEQQLVQIWEEILEVEKIGVNDNFFELGGYSLKLTQLSLRLNKLYPDVVKIQDVFDNPTITNLAAIIVSKQTFAHQNHEVFSEVEF